MPWDDGGTWDDGSLWDDDDAPPSTPGILISDPTINLNSHTAMEFWEVTKARAQETLPVWQQHLPNMDIGGKTHADLSAYIDQFEPAAMARTVAQDGFDGAARTVSSGLAAMKKLCVLVPKLIESQLEEDALLMKDVDDLYSTPLKSEAGILRRMRDLLPVWIRANAALAAKTPPRGPIVLEVGTTTYTAASAQALYEGHTGRINTMKDKAVTLEQKRSDLRALDRAVDSLNKRWYKAAKVHSETKPALADALEGITTEGGGSVPETYEINELTQGGDGGLQVLASYLPGGGDHATTRNVKWKIDGVDADYVHSAPLDPSGNALGPFTVGQTIVVITEVSNSVGTRTTAPRTITIQPPV